MAEPPFLMRLAAHVAEVSESEDISGGQGGTGSVFGVQDHRECFRSSGVSGRKMCCGAPETLRSEEGFEAGGTREEKYAVVPRKLRRVGHQ